MMKISPEIYFFASALCLVGLGCTSREIRPATQKLDNTPARIDYHDYQRVLTKSLNKGKVKFRSLQACRSVLDQFIDSLADIGPDSAPILFAGKNQTLAFWINVHNAAALQAGAENYPSNVKPKLRKFTTRTFTEKTVRVDGQTLTIPQLMDRARSAGHNDPRVELALSWPCKARGELLPEVFQADRMELQLTDVVKRALDNPNQVRIDHERWTLFLADPIYRHRQQYVASYEEGFHTENATLINALGIYADAAQRRRLNSALGYPIVPKPFDGSVNEQEEPECSLDTLNFNP